MVDEKVESPMIDSLNVDGVENRPVCPVCQGYLEDAERDYEFRRQNPDTRWFYCSGCDGHLGYHRMKKKWKVDPYDLNDSAAFKEFFGVTGEE